MKVGKIIWSAVLVCCIAVGVWQRHNLSIFWREYHCLWRDFCYREYTLVPHRPIIHKSVARSDPEAAAVTDMYLQNFWGQDDKYLPDLFENLIKFPDNEFLLLLGVNKIFRTNELDQGIGLKATERLIELDKDNSLYHYLKTVSLLSCRQNGDITPVLDEIKTAANCHNFYFPKTKYTKRVVGMAERASLHPKIVEALSSPFSIAPSMRPMHKFLLRYANRAFTDGETEKGLLIDDAINGIGRNQSEISNREAVRIRNSKGISGPFGYWSCPEMLELQRVNITEQRAKQNRIQLCPPVRQKIKTEETKENEDSGSQREPEVTIEELIIALPIAVHNGQMLFAMAIILLAFITISMVRGWSGNQRTGFVAMLSFAAASLCYFVVINWQCLGELWNTCHCCFSPQSIMHPRPFDRGNIVDYSTIDLFVFLICSISAAALIWVASRPGLRKMSFWFRIPLKLVLTVFVSSIATALYGLLMYLDQEWTWFEFLPTFVFIFIFALPVTIFASWLSKLRFVRGILVAIPLGSLTALASPYAYISQIPMILFVVICTLIVLNKPSDLIPFRKALKGIFSKQPELATIRSRAVKLLAPFIVIYWLLFVASVPTCARYIEQSYSAPQYSYPKSDLAPADETSYQQLLARFDSNDFELERFPRLAGLVMPQDLPPLLNMFLNKSSSSPFSLKLIEKFAEGNDVNSAHNRDMFKKKINDWNIIDVMQNCGRDTVNILVDAMDNPELEFALVSRAKLGDVRIKAKLEELLTLRLASVQPPDLRKWHHYWDRVAKPVDIICGLACISEPNEAGTMFMDYVARSDMSQLIKDDKFFRGIPLLPTTQAREVIKAYFAKGQDWQPSEEIIGWPMCEIIGTYADRDISEAVLKIMLRSENEDVIKNWDEPWEAPQDFDMHSADLLRQGLASRNEQLRAWCVWQLRKVGYQFSEKEETRLLADESWKVRANAVIAGGPKTAERAAKDPNPFVRLVASLSADE